MNVSIEAGFLDFLGKGPFSLCFGTIRLKINGLALGIRFPREKGLFQAFEVVSSKMNSELGSITDLIATRA